MNKDSKESKDTAYDVYYLCNCNKKKGEKEGVEKSGVFSTVFRRGIFPYRRLYNVTVCTEMKFSKEYNRHVITLNYDLERLLNVAYINPSYAKYRIKELNQLKKMFIRQDIEEKTYIIYFMSANILLIKARIVGNYLEKIRSKSVLSRYTHNAINYIKPLAQLDDEIIRENEISIRLHERLMYQSKNLYSSYENNLDIADFDERIQEYFKNNLWIYNYLYLVMRLGILANSLKDKDLCKKICNGIETLWENFIYLPQYTDETIYLIKDCCKQATKMYFNKDLFACSDYPDKYFEQFKSDKGIEDYFFRFAHSDNYQPVNQRNHGDNKLDAYTDLYIFNRILHNELDEHKKFPDM